MKGLLTKDFRIFLVQKRFFILLVFIALILNFGTDGSFAVSYMASMGSIFVLSTISYDEFDNGMPFLMTLPVTRKTYAREKYVFGIVLGFAMWLVGVALSIISLLIGGGVGDIKEAVIAAAVCIPLFIILLSVMIPIQLKFGAEKGRIALIAVFGIVFLICFGIGKFVEVMGIDMSQVAGMLSKVSENVLVVGVVAATVIILLISYRVSTIIMEKKEF